MANCADGFTMNVQGIQAVAAGCRAAKESLEINEETNDSSARAASEAAVEHVDHDQTAASDGIVAWLSDQVDSEREFTHAQVSIV